MFVTQTDRKFPGGDMTAFQHRYRQGLSGVAGHGLISAAGPVPVICAQATAHGAL